MYPAHSDARARLHNKLCARHAHRRASRRVPLRGTVNSREALLFVLCWAWQGYSVADHHPLAEGHPVAWLRAHLAIGAATIAIICLQSRLEWLAAALFVVRVYPTLPASCWFCSCTAWPCD